MKNYGILQFNNPFFAKESAILENDYKPTKYALIEKKIIPYTQKGGNEVVTRIIYSDDLEDLSQKLKKYQSWYNYPIGVYKDIQGNISELA